MPVPELTGSVLGGYRVGPLLGRGAYGWVYRADQTALDRAVALKVLDPVVARDPEAARRFDREGRSAAALDHPAIVDVYEAGEHDGFHFLAMRLVDGVPLDSRLPLPPPEMLAVLYRIASALDHAHACGVVHRDVKPSNILLEQGDPHRAWLGDFGIALSVRVAGPLSTATVGTPFYMAPEQLDPARTGPAADQYSLACVAYEALTGRRPYDGDDVMAVLLVHRTERAPSTGNTSVDTVLGKAMSKNPARRYPSVTAFVRALDTALRARPSRRRWVLVSGAAVVVAVAVTVVAMWPQASPAAPGWKTVSGPVSYTVPPGWGMDSGTALTTFTDAGQMTLAVGTERATVDPLADVSSLYSCEGKPLRVAGASAGSCDHGRGYAVVVSRGDFVARFSFGRSVSVADRTRILDSVRIGP
jgi:protein kinase-like protein